MDANTIISKTAYLYYIGVFTESAWGVRLWQCPTFGLIRFTGWDCGK